MGSLFKIFLIACAGYTVLATTYQIGYKFGAIDVCISDYRNSKDNMDIKEFIYSCLDRAKKGY